MSPLSPDKVIGSTVSEARAMDAAVRALARRDHSCAEVRRKLRNKGFPSPVIETVVARCLELNYLNDRRFSEAYVGQRLEKGFGPFHIRQQLRAKGVAGDMVEGVLKDRVTEDIEQAAGRRALSKKVRSERHRHTTGSDCNGRYRRFLAARGFSPQIIQWLMDDATDRKGDVTAGARPPGRDVDSSPC